jgi:hypothetical protein
MKVWLNDLKEGDIFYFPSTILMETLKCKHLGDAHNMNYKMSRIKYKILEGCDNNLKEIIGNNNELFVNQYVFTDYESANKVLIDKLKQELETTELSIIEHKRMIYVLDERVQALKQKLSM